MGTVRGIRHDAIKCPKCGKCELRFIPDIGWQCSNCGYSKNSV